VDPTTALADEPPAPPLIRFGSNLRLSVGLPGGDLYRNLPLNKVAKLLYQLEGSLDAVVLGQLVLGLRSGIGIASLANEFSDGCAADGATCRLTNASLGIHGEFIILPPIAPVRPWVGLAYSLEYLMMDEREATSLSGSFSGTDIDVSVGADFTLGKRVSWGPFVTYRTGKYTSVEADSIGVVPQTASITQPSRHDWLMLGLRTRY